jgi:DNA-binding ferritin-like protein
LADYEVLIRELRTAIKAAQDIEDEVTEDLMIGFYRQNMKRMFGCWKPI